MRERHRDKLNEFAIAAAGNRGVKPFLCGLSW
jgi:hypothetical protein